MKTEYTGSCFFQKYFLVFPTFVFLISYISTSAQSLNDTIRIKEVTVSEKYTPDITGLKILTLDSSVLSNNISSDLSQLLSENTTLFIKNYGPGRAATSSFRGAGANHTQVLWNGININSSMLGQSDFNLIPVFFADDISLYHGGAALSNNSGALGGSINIINKPDWSKKTTIGFMQTAGSYGSYGSYVSAGFGNNNFQSRTRIFYNYSENNFKYKLYDGAADETNRNADYFKTGIMQELYYKLNEKNIFSAVFWTDRNNNNLPGQQGNEKNNSDFIRTYIEWTHIQEKFTITTRSSFIYNYMNYIKKEIDVDSRNTEYVFTNFAEFKYHISQNFKFVSGITMNNFKVISNNYDTTSYPPNFFSHFPLQYDTTTYSIPSQKEIIQNSTRYRNTLSASSGINIILFKERLQTLIMFKQEISDKEFIPLIPSFGIDYKIFKTKDLHLKANVSRNYHLPSLNDLYWDTGDAFGNPNLVPEDGYFAESGLHYVLKTKNENHQITAEVTGFYSGIKNNITWFQITPATWSVTNLKEVVSKGTEVILKYSGKTAGWKYDINCNYAYTDAKNIIAINESDNSAGKQLTYVPFHNFNTNIRVSWKRFYFNYAYSFTGKRFRYSDNSWYLPPYILADITVGKIFNFKNYSVAVQGIAANILDRDYQVVAGYPMMRRNFSVAVKVGFNK
ncbi:MAG: TonB-dependent receptor [Bacteroidia bacterium]|nr:TonB-dependent receptor [Bacteroidia bacterium]